MLALVVKIFIVAAVFAIAFFAYSCSRRLHIAVPTPPQGIDAPSAKIMPYYDSATSTWNYPIASLPRDTGWGPPDTTSPNKVPQDYIPYHPVDMEAALPDDTTSLVFTWNGHSTVLLQMDGVRILFDPVLVENYTPTPLLTSFRRFQSVSPITVDMIPRVDVIVLSHDHYDHMNSTSLELMAPKTSLFLVPMGVGERLRDWGIDSAKIREYTWWQEDSLRTLDGHEFWFVNTPARHFSGRTLTDWNRTLFSSWVFRSKRHNVFYSGDGSYGPHFAQIGEHYGPFDLAFIECGQYNPRWAKSHMFPEETVQAAQDVRAKLLMPVHWGAFSLAPHDWQDPPRRVKAEAAKKQFPLLMPEVGETVNFATSERVF